MPYKRASSATAGVFRMDMAVPQCGASATVAPVTALGGHCSLAGCVWIGADHLQACGIAIGIPVHSHGTAVFQAPRTYCVEFQCWSLCMCSGILLEHVLRFSSDVLAESFCSWRTTKKQSGLCFF